MAGVGSYTFGVMSLLLPACLSVCRHANITDEQLSKTLVALKTRNGILLFNAILWTYGLLVPLPFVLENAFGQDPMGVCGLARFNSVFLWIYYIVFMSVALISYAITFIFYRKLNSWVNAKTSMIILTAETKETLLVTRNLMRLIRWLLFLPVITQYPAVCLELALRFHPNLVTVRTARMFMSIAPIAHMLDPIVTILSVKRYRLVVFSLFPTRLKQITSKISNVLS